MFDFLCYILAAAMVLYQVLWLVGCRLPGVGDQAFRGWRYSHCDDERGRSPQPAGKSRPYLW